MNRQANSQHHKKIYCENLTLIIIKKIISPFESHIEVNAFVFSPFGSHQSRRTKEFLFHFIHLNGKEENERRFDSHTHHMCRIMAHKQILIHCNRIMKAHYQIVNDLNIWIFIVSSYFHLKYEWVPLLYVIFDFISTNSLSCV